MTVDVAVDELADRIRALPPTAFVVSVGNGGAPHVVSAPVRWSDGRVVATVGKTTAANAGARPEVSLLWPHAEDGYGLIVDGTASLDSGEVAVAPQRAVLHRLADRPADDDHPSCIRLLG